MKFSVVIGVGRDPESLVRATKTQGLLLDHLGEKLASIRLAVPRLLRLACSGAVDERPDVLVVAGGQRTARAAGQIAHKHGIPILFLPGLRSPEWARSLWGSLSLEDMIEAMAREHIRATRIGVGFAGTEMFFGNAHCGLLPQLSQMNQALKETEALAEGLGVLGRAMNLVRMFAGTGIEIRRPQCALMRASALMVTAQSPARSLWSRLSFPRLQTFNCAVWQYRTPVAYLGAVLKAAGGTDCCDPAQAEHFDCETLTVNTRAGRWLLLDGEPVRSEESTVLRFMPNAVRVCAFRNEGRSANDNGTRHFAREARF
jgi:hypothetical protein